jgi:hypothetical protein
MPPTRRTDYAQRDRRKCDFCHIDGQPAASRGKTPGEAIPVYAYVIVNAALAALVVDLQISIGLVRPELQSTRP